MKPANFAYHTPRSLAEAVTVLANLSNEETRILAGGQSLVPAMAFRLANPVHLVDINRIDELNRMSVRDGALVIGAGVRHAAFDRPVVDGPLGEILSRIVHHIAHFPIRTRGTFCGSLANADPASEWCLVAATLDARMVAISIRGLREIDASDFFRGLMTTALAEDEILMEVRIPVPKTSVRLGFEEVSRRAGDYAIAMALVGFSLADGAITDARVGIGGAEEHPRRIPEAEAVLNGFRPSRELFTAAAQTAADAVEPLEDLQADAAYRRDIVRAVTRRALAQCL